MTFSQPNSLGTSLRSAARLALAAALLVLPSRPLHAAAGFNLIGDNPTNTTFARGPGLAAFETIPAPQGNPALYQRRLVVAGFKALNGGPLRAVSGAFFGSQNVQNQLTPVDLRQIPGNIICSVWTNGLDGFSARPGQPDLEFNAGSTTNLQLSGSITNPATGTIYPLYLARAELAAASAPATALEAGSNPARRMVQHPRHRRTAPRHQHPHRHRATLLPRRPPAMITRSTTLAGRAALSERAADRPHASPLRRTVGRDLRARRGSEDNVRLHQNPTPAPTTPDLILPLNPGAHGVTRPCILNGVILCVPCSCGQEYCPARCRCKAAAPHRRRP